MQMYDPFAWTASTTYDIRSSIRCEHFPNYISTHAFPSSDLFIVPYPRGVWRLPLGLLRHVRRFGDEQRAGGGCALGVVLDGKVAVHAAGVGTQAGEWCEYDAVCQGHLPDLNGLKEFARLRICGGLRGFAHMVPGRLKVNASGDAVDAGAQPFICHPERRAESLGNSTQT